MSPLQARDYDLDADRVGGPEALPAALRRRLGGRFAVDPFGLDPQLADLITPLVTAAVRVDVQGGERLPRDRAAVLVSNRGLGVGEPMVLGVAVRRATGRRLRIAGAPHVPLLGPLSRRLGAVSAGPEDLAACLRAGHLVAVPLAPTWLRRGAGSPPLALVQAMIGFTVFPVAVTPGGPLGTPLRPWKVRIGPHIALDSSYPPGDPLGAAELGEAVREAVEQMLGGEVPEMDEQPTVGLTVPGA